MLAGLLITPSAHKQLTNFLAQHGKHVRLEINAGGCSGFDIKFSADTARDDDMRFGPQGAELLVDKISLGLIDGATIDFSDRIGKEGFSVENIPNTDARCGCGKSFSLAE